MSGSLNKVMLIGNLGDDVKMVILMMEDVWKIPMQRMKATTTNKLEKKLLILSGKYSR